MKLNRKVIFSTATVLGAAALITGGTIAYFTDHTETTNTFTVGNVDIELYESQLHRVNANMATSGREGSLTSAALISNPHVCSFTNASMPNINTYCTPNITAYNNADNVVSAWDNGHVRKAFTATTGGGAGQSGVFSDEQIKTDADTDEAVDATSTNSGNYLDYVADEYSNLVPGKSVRKFVYVENVDTTTPAYVRIRVKIPAEVANLVTVKIPSTPFGTSEETAVGSQNKAGDIVNYAYFDMDEATQYYYNYVDTHNKSTSGMGATEDVILTFIVHDALKGGEMTYWSPINTVTINSDADVADLQNLTTERQFQIDVSADAIQADGFASAAAAFAAYDAQNN